MSDFQFQDENSIRAVFSMEVGREMNDHNMLYNKSLPNQHPISAITGLTEALAEGSSNLQTEIDRAEAAEQALDDKIEAETTRAEGVESGLNTAISNETSARIQADTTLQNNITAEENRAKGIENGLRSDLTAETTARQNADNNLQSQIDAISASSDVTDIVGTYAELQAYDTSTLTNDDIIKVLQDESQGGATTYYRWVVSGSSGSFVLIGSEGPYYTKAEADELYDEKQDKITATNKLVSDLVNDTNQINKFVTASEKSQITTNANNIMDLENNKASTSLDNLTADGQMIIDTVDGKISNCVLEIPQNIKLELNNNVLTLKAGSVVVGMGDGAYSTYTFTSDLVRENFALNEDGKFMLVCSSTYFTWWKLSDMGSGSSLPADNSTYNKFFLTTDKRIYSWVTDHWAILYVYYPIAIIERDSNNVVHFAKDSNGNNMIFNGMGFIGHHIFIYPNINAYTPAGLDPDGSLASIKIGTNALRIIEALSGYGYDSLKRWISLQSNHTISNWSAYKEVNHDSEADYSIANIRYYARDINLIKMYRSGSVSAVDGVPLVEYYYDGSNITSFSPKQCVRLATVDMLDKVQDQVDTNTTAISGKQDTLVSGTNIKTINSTTVLGNGNFALADQSLSNLDSNGQMIVDSQNGTISNCILEIPQNLKLEFSNGVLTVKAGSVLVNSGEPYSTITLTSDATLALSPQQNTDYMVFMYAGSAFVVRRISDQICSGDTDALAGTPYHVWFDTSTKIIKSYGSNTSPDAYTQLRYPICVLKTNSSGNAWEGFAKDSNGNDMIFNGAGFIGHHVFVYPNVKALIPDGFNDDGSIKSVEWINNSLRIIELVISTTQPHRTLNAYLQNSAPVIYRGRYVKEVDDVSELPADNYQYYVKNINKVMTGTQGDGYYPGTLFVRFAYNGTTVTDFTIRQPVRMATVEMVDKKQADLTTVSGYDATATQILKNINGVLTWVTEE